MKRIRRLRLSSLILCRILCPLVSSIYAQTAGAAFQLQTVLSRQSSPVHMMNDAYGAASHKLDRMEENNYA